jgi:hypothetical protein
MKILYSILFSQDFSEVFVIALFSDFRNVKHTTDVNAWEGCKVNYLVGKYVDSITARDFFLCNIRIS